MTTDPSGDAAAGAPPPRGAVFRGRGAVLVHILGAALLVTALSLDALRDTGQPSPSATLDAPRDALVAALAAQGFALAERTRHVFNEERFAFVVEGCVRPLSVVASASGRFEASTAQTQAEALSGAPRTYWVYGGARLDGPRWRAVAPRLLVWKAAIGLGLVPSTPWASTILAVFEPEGCPAPQVDWSRLDASAE